MRRRGFTIIELVVALLIAAALAAATTRVISGALRARTTVESRSEASGRALRAADVIARDLANLHRDPVADETLLRVLDDGETGLPGDGLMLFARSDRRARAVPNENLGFPGTAEGGLYEVQMRLELPAEDVSGDREAYDLWVRMDPIPDDVVEGGGVARLVARGVVDLQAEVHDGGAWVEGWDSDRDGLPYAVRVTVSATDDDGRSVRTVSRTIGFARTPLPVLESGLGNVQLLPLEGGGP